jgi:hypothetical protein
MTRTSFTDRWHRGHAIAWISWLWLSMTAKLRECCRSSQLSIVRRSENKPKLCKPAMVPSRAVPSRCAQQPGDRAASRRGRSPRQPEVLPGPGGSFTLLVSAPRAAAAAPRQRIESTPETREAKAVLAKRRIHPRCTTCRGRVWSASCQQLISRPLNTSRTAPGGPAIRRTVTASWSLRKTIARWRQGPGSRQSSRDGRPRHRCGQRFSLAGPIYFADLAGPLLTSPPHSVGRWINAASQRAASSSGSSCHLLSWTAKR